VITCRELISFLLEYLDGTLAAEEMDRFERHLALCDSCVAYLHTYQSTIRMEKLVSFEDAAVPEELVRAVVASRHV